MSTPPAPAAAPPAPEPAPQPAPGPDPAPTPTPPVDPGTPEGFVPRRRLNEVEQERKRLEAELTAERERVEAERRREETAVQRAERERDELRSQLEQERTARQTAERTQVFDARALTQAGDRPPIRADALEAARRLADIARCDTAEHADDVLADLVERYPFLVGEAQPTPPPRIGTPASGGTNGTATPDAGTPEGQAEARSGLARWLSGNVLGGST
jgi:hypothetical protein